MRLAHPASAWIALSSTLLALTMSGILVGVVVNRDEPWRPLGPFPDQQVISMATVPYGGRDIPLVDMSAGVVVVEGRKCYREAVTVTGVRQWFSERPPGLALVPEEALGSGSVDVEAKCYTSTFHNNIPATVVAFVTSRSAAEPGGFVVFRLVGRVTAVAEGGRTSEPLTWRTEQFALVP